MISFSKKLADLPRDGANGSGELDKFKSNRHQFPTSWGDFDFALVQSTLTVI